MQESTNIASEVDVSSTSLMEDGVKYGPERPHYDCGYHLFSTPRSLTGYAGKILRDLIKVARLYNGREARIFLLEKGERCTRCTNLATGERLMTNCPVCRGTGHVQAWKYINKFWTLIDFGPGYDIATRGGNTENPNGIKEQIIIFGAPTIEDQSLIIFEESRTVYKVYDVMPHIVAMRGSVIAQMASCSRLTPGREEYKLITW